MIRRAVIYLVFGLMTTGWAWRADRTGWLTRDSVRPNANAQEGLLVHGFEHARGACVLAGRVRHAVHLRPLPGADHVLDPLMPTRS